MENKFVAVIEYDGGAYHGWQLQKNLPTIQGAIETALHKITGGLVRVHGAGRTDAGVHALGQVAHFTLVWNHEPARLQKALNALLPNDTAIVSLSLANFGFHARHSAKNKTYVYSILNSSNPSPIRRNFTWRIPRRLDTEAMNAAARELLGTHDFATFGSPTGGTPSTVRQILKTRCEQCNDLITFTITGTGFLKYMVRSIVGTLVEVGIGKKSPTDFPNILESKDRSMAGATAPAHGLCLHSVEYTYEDKDSGFKGIPF